MTQRDEPTAGGRRIHLVVLFGGESAEHDVSCTTAAHVLRAADPTRYRITPIGISTTGEWAIATAAAAALASGADALPGRLDPAGTPVAPDQIAHLDPPASVGKTSPGETSPGTTSPGEASPAADEITVVIPLLHGPLGEDGTVQGMLELANVPYVGSGVLGSAVAMDKAMAKQVLAASGIAQARHVAFADHTVTPAVLDDVVEQLGLPLFVKPANMGSSVGVSKVRTRDDLTAAIELAAAYDEMIVVEEAIVGREIEVAVLGTTDPQASVAGEVVPGEEFYSYTDKYVTDAAQLLIPAPLDDVAMEEVRQLAIDAFRALRCEGLARVDFFYEDPADGGRGFLCNEVNTMPGFTPISQYPKLWIHSGMTYPELIDRLVDLAIERHSRRRRNTAR